MSKTYRTSHRMESRRQVRRLKRTWRRNVSGLSMRSWVREQADSSLSTEFRELCSGWLQRKGLSP